MWSLLIITCIIFQTAVAVFLLNGVRTSDNIDKHLRAMLVILLVHLSTKFLLLTALKDDFLYTQIPTGFGLAYGPLLFIIVRSVIGKPMSPRAVLGQFSPFLVFSLLYVLLVIAALQGNIGRFKITRYASWYQWLVIASLYGYPVYVKTLLCRTRSRREYQHIQDPETGSRREKLRLVNQMANVLLIGISIGSAVYAIHWTAGKVPTFDLRLLPYMCFSAIPVLILRYRLQENWDKRTIRQESLTPKAVPAEIPMITERPAVAMEAGAQHGATNFDRRYEKSGLDASKMDEYETTLSSFIAKNKIYLDPDLSLELLASCIKVSKHHLTQLLNERMEKNFYNFINEYRIDEAIRRLNNPVLDVNILSLAFDCGFNSRSSFNNYFKKRTGFTPSAYRKQQLMNSQEKQEGGPPRIIQRTLPSV